MYISYKIKTILKKSQDDSLIIFEFFKTIVSPSLSLYSNLSFDILKYKDKEGIMIVS